MPRRRAVGHAVRAAALAALLLVTGCSSADPDAPQHDRQGDAQVVAAGPRDPLTVVADADPVAAAVGVSRALFTGSDVAVVARDGDAAGTLLAASTAVGLGVPLLLTRPKDDTAAAEAHRLGVRDVLAVGDVDPAGLAARTVAVPVAPQAVSEATGLRFGATTPVDGADGLAAVAGLDSRRPDALQPTGTSPADHPATDRPTADRPGDVRTVPAVPRQRPLDGVVVLASGSPESLAGVATARAAGARVIVTGGTDPRASADAVQALADHRTTAVVALGADFAGAADPGWETDTPRTGTPLPGGGPGIFPGRMRGAL